MLENVFHDIPALRSEELDCRMETLPLALEVFGKRVLTTLLCSSRYEPFCDVITVSLASHGVSFHDYQSRFAELPNMEATHLTTARVVPTNLGLSAGMDLHTSRM